MPNKKEVNAASIPELVSWLRFKIRPNIRYVVSIKEWSKRSLNANAQVFVWIKAISEHTGDDLKTVEGRCKLYHGLPILLAGDDGVVTGWILEKLRFNTLTDEQQVQVISAMEVTRKFTTKQHNEYRDSIQQFWLNNGLDLRYMD